MNRRSFPAAALLGFLFLAVFGCSGNGSPAVSSSSPGGKSAYDYGMDRLHEGNYIGASYQFKKATEENPDSIPAYLALARAYAQAGNLDHDYFKLAQAVYDTLKTRIPEDDLRLVEGEAQLKVLMWQVDDAINLYESALADNPEDCELWVLLGQAIQAKGVELRELVGEDAERAKLEEALDVYHKAIKICPDSFDAYHGIAVILTQRKQYQDVVKMYVDLRQQYPDSLRVLRDYTHARFTARDWSEAADGFAQLLDQDPRPQERLMYIAALRKLKRFDDADKQKAIYLQTAPKFYGPKELTPEDVLREQLGINELAEKAGTLMEQKKYEESRAVWKQARDRAQTKVNDPKYGDAARTIMIWVERRLDYLDELEGKAKP